ncbi:aminoacyl-tRNA hydrolase [Patescibacteria group bacterium]|nr:MAG: aminoacyl-tRNA hydrolase [Patescibacteria group bacterium]
MERRDFRSPTARIPAQEIRLEFVRSSGPGGQNVNKTASKVQLRWHVGGSSAFSDFEKAAIRAYAGHRLNSEDEIVLVAQTERSQSQNRNQVIQRLQDVVAAALTPKKKHKKTRVSRSQKQKRLEDKRRTGEVKRARKPPRGE